MEIIKKTNELIRKLISEDDLEYMQDILIQLKIYHQITDILTYILLVTLIVFLLLFLISLIFGVSVFIVLLSTLPVMLFINYLVYKKQKRLDSIEEDLPDYL